MATTLRTTRRRQHHPRLHAAFAACLLTVVVPVLLPATAPLAGASSDGNPGDSLPGVDTTEPANPDNDGNPGDGPNQAPPPATEPGSPDGDGGSGTQRPGTTIADRDATAAVGTGSATPVTPLATTAGGATIEAVDWRPGVVNTQTAELYGFIDTGGVLVIGLGNTSVSPMEVTDVILDGDPVEQLRLDRKLMWWRVAPTVIPAGGVGAVTLKLMSPYAAGINVDIEVETTLGTLQLTTSLRDEPVRLSNVTLDQQGQDLLVWVRNDGTAVASLPSELALSGQVVPAVPSQTSLKRGEVAYYRLDAPPGTRARYVSVGVTPTVAGTPRPLYAHLKVAPAFNAAGGYGNAGNFASEQAALGLNLVTRGMFSNAGQQQAFNDNFCTPLGIRVWLTGAEAASDATLATQGADPCVAGFGRDEPEFRIYPANDEDTSRWDAMQAFADQSARQSTATGDELMDHITNAIGRSISSFAMLADVAGNDHYATDSVASDGDSSHPLEEAGYFTRLTRRAAEPRPSYDWAQWSADQSWQTKEAWNRQPSVNELRLQAYSMLQEGVKSLLWFTFNRDRTLIFPDLAREVARINREQNLVFNMVGEGAEAPGLATVVTPSGDDGRIRAGALAGTGGVAVLVTNLDYSYTRVVRSKPIPPSPTPFAAFRARSGVQVRITVPDWVSAAPGTPQVVLVDPATGPQPIVSTPDPDGLIVTLPQFTTTTMLVVVPNATAAEALDARWAQLTTDIPAASGPDAPPGPVPPPNQPWSDTLPDLTQDWEVRTRDVVMGTPVVDGGAVFAVSRDGVVRSLNFTDGTQQWATQLPGKVFGGVAVGTTGVYAVTTDGVVVRLDRTTGAELGRVELPTEVMSTPVIAGGRLVVAGIDGVTRGLDPTTLSAVWGLFTIAGPLIADLVSLQVGANDVVVVGSTSGLVSAVEASNGAIVWQRSLGNQILAAPGIGDGRVVVGTNGGDLAALSANDGAVLWSVRVPAPVLRQPGVGNGQVVVGQPAYGGCIGVNAGPSTFLAFDAASGAAQWSAGLTGCDFGHSAPAFGDGAWFAGTAWGSIIRMNPVSGKPDASLVTDAWVLATPVVVDGKVVVGSDDQRVRLLDGGGPDPTPPTTAPAPVPRPVPDGGSGGTGTLPSTGAAVAVLLLVGAVLAAVGGVATLAARRRSSTPKPVGSSNAR